MATKVPSAMGKFPSSANVSLLGKVTTLAVMITGLGWQLHTQQCLSALPAVRP
jgi:hypothetical protein